MEKVDRIDIIADRVGAVRSKLAETGLDALVVTKEENKYYLSMFPSTSYELVITRDDAFILTDFRYAEAAEDLAPVFRAVITEPGYSIREFLNECGAEKLGLEFKDVNVDYYNLMQEALPDRAVLVSYDGMIEKIRSVKDKMELAYIAMAEKIGDQAFSYILGQIKPGVSEKEIALKLELKMRELGAEKLSFDTIVVSGERSSLPHGMPSDKLIEKGDLVTMDFGCKFMGYCSDMTRTIAVGSVSPDQKKIYDIVLRAQKETCQAIKAGVRAADVDAVARSIIEAEGYGRYFGHGLGHGVGLEIHEAPTANPRSREVLEQGMLVTIEPGIYLPKKFGVRIEDLSIVTENGIINLTGSEKELIII